MARTVADMNGSNMLLEDVLAILGKVGTVSLRKGTNDVSASPGHKADTEGWSCEISIAGYLRPWGHGGAGGSQLILGRRGSYRGLSALEAARRTLDQVEEFLASDEGARCRDCYVKSYEDEVERTGGRSDYFNDRFRHPGPMVPEAKIDWGD